MSIFKEQSMNKHTLLRTAVPVCVTIVLMACGSQPNSDAMPPLVPTIMMPPNQTTDRGALQLTATPRDTIVPDITAAAFPTASRTPQRSAEGSLIAEQTPTVVASPAPSVITTQPTTEGEVVAQESENDSAASSDDDNESKTDDTATSNGSTLEQLHLEAIAAETTTFRYVFPVQNAKVSYGSSHHDYPASDIFCAEGSDYVAVTDGVIDFVSSEDLWSPKTDNPEIRGGISIAFIGVDGIRYYGSHLSSVEPGLTPGITVKAGQLLGKTGKSGNARGTPPHLHFGISRPSISTDWRVRRGEMNPYKFLQAWSKGEGLQPFFGER